MPDRFTRDHLVGLAVGALRSGRSVQVHGDPYSGRSHFLEKTADHFRQRSFWIRGSAGLHIRPFAALQAALGCPPTFGESREALRAALGTEDAVLFIDDADLLDEPSWAVVASVQTWEPRPMISAWPRGSYAAAQRAPSGTPLPIVLRSMSPAELGDAIRAQLGYALSSPTLRTVIAISAGNVGLAVAVVGAAARAGHLRIDSGEGEALTDLWTPELNPLAERILASVEPGTRDALERLAAVGPIGLELAEQIFTRDDLVAMSTSRVASYIADAGGAEVVTAHPFLAAYFRSQPPSLPWAITTRDLSGNFAVERTVGRPDTALPIAVAHERYRRQVSAAASQWLSERTRDAATALLAAYRGAGGNPTLIRRIIDESRDAPGSLGSKLIWLSLATEHIAFSEGNPEAAIELLASEGGAHPELRAHVNAWTFLFQRMTGLPHDLALLDVSTDGCLPGAEAALTLSKALDAFLSGSLQRALDLLDEAEAEPGMVDPDFVAKLRAWSAAYLGQKDLAEDIVRRNIEQARNAYQHGQLLGWFYIGAVNALFDLDVALFMFYMDEAWALGEFDAQIPMIRTGLSAMAAVSRELFGVGHQYREAGGKEASGAFVFMDARLMDVVAAAERGDRDSAADLAEEIADELIARENITAATLVLIRALDIHPSERVVKKLVTLSAQVESPMIAQIAGLFTSAAAGDASMLVAAAQAAEQGGLPARAAALWRYIQSTLIHQGDADGAIMAQENITRLESERAANAGPWLTLSPREREVAALAGAGMTNAQIAGALYINVRTVETHVSNAMRKLGARTRRDMAGVLPAGSGLAPDAASNAERVR